MCVCVYIYIYIHMSTAFFLGVGSRPSPFCVTAGLMLNPHLFLMEVLASLRSMDVDGNIIALLLGISLIYIYIGLT